MRWSLLTACALLALSTTTVRGQAPDTVQPANQDLESGAQTDDLGITISIPVTHPGRRYPASHEFPSGPEIGERLPEFSLPNQDGEAVEYHADRGNAKSIVVFYRSAVW
ncbi:MAG: hypothetical protein VYE68_16755 [Acidobacteriota bacterium]|nr:hypothetical protein [Acidobacteriota bacterium]